MQRVGRGCCTQKVQLHLLVMFFAGRDAKDVDGADSLPLAIDRKTPNLGRYSGCRRVARTIYLGSAPTSKTSHPGIDDRTIKLGCVQPGESPAVFGDALRRLSDQATHLYVDGTRYWYSLQPSVTRLAADLAAQFEIQTVWEELVSRLNHQPMPETGRRVP